MASPHETIEKVQSGLDPYVKPREQVNYIRRILALHIGSIAHNGQLQHPLSLPGTLQDVRALADVQGVHKDYVDALRENVMARRDFEALAQASKESSAESLSSGATSTDGQNSLKERIALLKLQQKRESLLIVQNYLDALAEKPAAADGFLDVAHALQTSNALPSIPKNVIDGLASEHAGIGSNLSTRIVQLEKAVLRARLQLKHDEKLLEEARDRCSIRADAVSHGAKLEALEGTRKELINWIETELGKASGEEVDNEADGAAPKNHWQSSPDASSTTTQLESIKEKYNKYLSLRKRLLSLVIDAPSPSFPPPLQNTQKQSGLETSTVIPTNHHILIPYLEKLMAVSRHQKAMINHKSHANSVLTKLSRDTRQQLSQLAQESELLHAYPSEKKAHQRTGSRRDLSSSSDQPDVSTRVKPWVLAAESAKIGTLESVADNIEKGQVALENAMSALSGIDKLLGNDDGNDTVEEDARGTNEEDVWLEEGLVDDSPARKHTARKRDKSGAPKDMWAGLHGNLGLLGHDDNI